MRYSNHHNQSFMQALNRLIIRSKEVALCRINYFKYMSTMRFVQFIRNTTQGLGVELKESGDVVDVSGYDPSVSSNMRDFIAGGSLNVLKAKSAVESGKNVIPRDQLTLLAPITNPDKLICIGMNYVDHCKEQDVPVPAEPVVFSKFNSSIIAPNEGIPYPSETKELDWEVEMAIIVGKQGKNIAQDQAMDYVFGYTIAHDVSARDWQMKRNGGQFLVGKSMDGFCPLGPAIVPKEDIADPHNLHLWTKVNGVIKQDSSTNQLVFKTAELISFLSRFFTLKPGDTILTGTPPGVGVFRKPPEFLKVGDVVEVGIENLGTLTNAVV